MRVVSQDLSYGSDLKLGSSSNWNMTKEHEHQDSAFGDTKRTTTFTEQDLGTEGGKRSRREICNGDVLLEEREQVEASSSIR